MYFNSYIFILAFLPIVVSVYYLINRTQRYLVGQMWLTGASLVFIGYMNAYYALITIVCVLTGYAFILAVTNERLNKTIKKALFTGGIIFHIATLLYFKYFNFFIDNINVFLKKEIPFFNIILPIGISFYTFQQLAYLVDCYREPSVKCSFLEYILFITYFPKFLQGPILLHGDMLPQLRDVSNKQFCADHFAKGLYAFALGLGKKVLLADNIALLVNTGYQNIDSLNTPSALFTMVAYSLQLYFDFSGYCDMAIGIGEMLQIQLPINFDSPYKAVKVTEIWARWHMTLTRFFTKYLYIPLGGNRKGTVRMYVNTFIVFLISGLWHGAAWTFVIWGILHGIAMMFSKLLTRCKIVLPKAVGWLATFGFWVFSFAIFRASSLEEAGKLFLRLLHGGFGRISGLFSESMENLVEVSVLQRLDFGGILNQWPEIIPLLFVGISLLSCMVMRNTQQKMAELRLTYTKMVVTVFLIFYSIISLGGMNVFLYVNF